MWRPFNLPPLKYWKNPKAFHRNPQLSFTSQPLNSENHSSFVPSTIFPSQKHKIFHQKIGLKNNLPKETIREQNLIRLIFLCRRKKCIKENFPRLPIPSPKHTNEKFIKKQSRKAFNSLVINFISWSKRKKKNQTNWKKLFAFFNNSSSTERKKIGGKIALC